MTASTLTNIPQKNTFMLNETADRSDFLAAMRNAACGVSVVTTNGIAGRHGGTVTSFCSVSADPPTMLVCLNKASRIMQAVADNGCFNINILSEENSFLANRFAGLHDSDVQDRFTGVEFSDSDQGPILPNSVVLSCALEQMIESGSHGVFIGLVERVVHNDLKPLTYSNGAYHSIVAQRQQGNL